MNKKTVASVIMLSLLATGCARFKERTQAIGSYDYEKSSLRDSDYDSGDYTRHEQRPTYNIQPLTEEQNELGLQGKELDVRPPTQLIPVIDGVLLDANTKQTKITFNAFDANESMQEKVWQLILDYLQSKDALQVVANQQELTINTGPVVRNAEYGSLSKNRVHEEGVYQLKLVPGRDKLSISFEVNVISYQQLNDNRAVKQVLQSRSKRSVEIAFINDLLEYAYLDREAKQQNIKDDKPLPIKLGFDDNHQIAWVIDADFEEAWNKLPALLTIMSFEPVQNDKNLGYFLVKFVPKDDKYWLEHGLNPIDLPAGEYFVQLGELTGGATSVLWLDADKTPLSDQQVTDLYLSITDKIRSVILENAEKPKSL